MINLTLKKYLIPELQNVDVKKIAEYANNYYHMINKENTVISSTSSIIGRSAEIKWMDVFAKYNPRDVSGKKRAGDFCIEKNNCRLMVEIKKYKGKVPTKEVEKFYRDLENYDCGLFIASSGIVGKQAFHVENNCVFIGEYNETAAVAAAEYLLLRHKRIDFAIYEDKWQKIKKNCQRMAVTLNDLDKIKGEIIHLRDYVHKGFNKLYQLSVKTRQRADLLANKIIECGGGEEAASCTLSELFKTQAENPIVYELLTQVINNEQISDIFGNKEKIEITLRDKSKIIIAILKTRVNFITNIINNNLPKIIKHCKIANGIITMGITKKNMSSMIGIIKEYLE